MTDHDQYDSTAAQPKRLDVNGNRVYRVSQISVLNGKTLTLAPNDQAFYVGTSHHGQFPSHHTFVLLEQVDPDA